MELAASSNLPQFTISTDPARQLSETEWREMISDPVKYGIVLLDNKKRVMKYYRDKNGEVKLASIKQIVKHHLEIKRKEEEENV